MRKNIVRLINKIFNPLILWCFGWERKKEKYAGSSRTLWKNPKTGHWVGEEVAMWLVETRGTDA